MTAWVDIGKIPQATLWAGCWTRTANTFTGRPNSECAMTTDTLHSSTHHSAWPIRWLLAVLLIVIGLVLVFMLFKPLKVLPDLSPAPTYQLVDQHAQPFGSEDLDGKVALYNFVFTHCTTVCPAMTSQMLQVQHRLEDQGLLGSDVELVTITFDPERDTPERLAEYAASVKASDTGWHWLTGDLIEIKQLVGGEFGVYFERVPLDEDTQSTGHDHEGYDFVHSTVFVIVDGSGEIRAEYQQMLDIDQTLRDIRLVVREQKAGPLARPLFQAAHSIRAYP